VGLRQLPGEEAQNITADDDDDRTESQNDDDDDNDDDNDDDDDNEGQNNVNRRGNQGIGNGPEGADPGNSSPRGGSNDESGRTPAGRGDR
jgi:hypothetical protein